MLHREKIQTVLSKPPYVVLPAQAPQFPFCIVLVHPNRDSLCIRATSLPPAPPQTYMMYIHIGLHSGFFFSPPLSIYPGAYSTSVHIELPHSSKAEIVAHSFAWVLVDLSRPLLVDRHLGCFQFWLLL